MAESNENKNFESDLIDDEEEDPTIHRNEILNHSRDDSPIDDPTDDIEYKLAENRLEKIPELLLNKFNFKIDNEIVTNESNRNADSSNNNEDDFIDEDFLTELDSLKTAIKKEDEIAQPNKSVLISCETDNKICDEALTSSASNCNGSEPTPKQSKHEVNLNERIQFKSDEIIEFIIKKCKQKTHELKHHSALLSSDQHLRKKIHKTDLIKTKSLITKSTHTLNTNESAFLWTELEAFIKQHEQTGPSSCGASAIINVLKALDYDIDYDKVNNTVKVNTRIPESMASTTTLAQYLFSRSIAGMNAAEMIENIKNVTSNEISGRFFSFNTYTLNNRLAKWLAYWIRKGAAPVALLNLQKTPIIDMIADAWHHQMIYAISSNEIYLTNPLERKPIDTMIKELDSESVLLVRSEDVLKRYNANPINLNEFLLMKEHSEEERQRWYDLNVLGQVVNVLRCPRSATHITIPASYVPGITLFAKTDSTLYQEILNWSDLISSNYL